ncbi:MAG: hypothetical protein AB2708_11230 [Candidatus Thiodiazotropha taylori]
MFNKAQAMTEQLHIAVAIPFLVIGVAFTVVGAYHLSTTLLPIQSANENGGLAAIWELLFGFGAASIANLIAARVKYLSKPPVRKLFTFPFFVATVLFLGYFTYGALSALVGMGKELWGF